MADFITYLQNRVTEVKDDLEDANARLQHAESDRRMLEAELQGYEKALTAELRRQGKVTQAVPATSNEPAQSSDIGAEAENGPNKAEFARHFIRLKAEAGVTPSDLLKGFQEAGIPIGRAYIYALIQRLQKSKPPAIRSKRGKWFPVLETEQPVNGIAEKALP